MDKKTLVYETLRNHGCSTAKQISGFIKRETGETVTTSSVSGQLRSFVNQGRVGKSNATGSTVYWVCRT